MNDATHVFCPKCNDFEPAIYNTIVIEELSASLKSYRFQGLEVKCRNCGFEVTKIGAISHRDYGEPE